MTPPRCEDQERPSRRRRLRGLALGIGAWLLFWTMQVTTAVQDYARNGGRTYWQPLLWESSSFFTITALMLVQRRFAGDYSALLDTPARWFARQLRWLPMYWIAFVPVAFGIRVLVYKLVGDTYTFAPWGRTLFYENVKLTVFYCLFSTIMFGVLSYQAMVAEKARAAQSAELLRQAQMRQLTGQMQPHFLFNALNMISSLMHEDVERADSMLVGLADLLRSTLAVGDLQVAPLDTELRLLRAYAELMQERLADRVTLEWRLEPGLDACPVPVMSLQPLLENVFKHTVEQRRGMTRIVISARREGASALLAIEDDSGRLDGGVAGTGVGLGNLRRRLEMLHGGAASLTLSQLAPAGVRAEMRLPCGS